MWYTHTVYMQRSYAAFMYHKLAVIVKRNIFLVACIELELIVFSHHAACPLL